jgi:nucleoid-associated protein YgaU
MGLIPATIEILDKEAIGKNGLTQFLKVQYNPQEYSLTKGAEYAEIPVYGIDSPILQFIRGQAETISIELFFDTTEDGMGDNVTDVRDRTRPFYQLVKIQPKTHAPPRIRFTWGQGLSFKAIVDSVQQSFDLFNPAGIPLRATLTLSMKEYKTLEEQLSELKPESADHTKTYAVQRGDTLSRIASREYGNPALWREIADENPGLPDVRRLVPGTLLVIPPLEKSARRR